MDKRRTPLSKSHLRLIFSLFIFSFIFFAPSEAKPFNFNKIRVASIDWCPQLCTDKEKPGYITEIAREALTIKNIEITIDIYPWSRAILLARSGEYDAILAPAKKEAPDLLYPAHEVGIQRMCFFTRAHSHWAYAGSQSLLNRRVGVAQDGSLEELTDFAKNNPTIFEYLPYGNNFLDMTFQKLSYQRLDAILFTYNSTIYYLNNKKIINQFKEAGCISKTFVYLAFTPAKQKIQQTKAMIKEFDSGMKILTASKKIKNIMAKYGLNYWH